MIDSNRFSRQLKKIVTEEAPNLEIGQISSLRNKCFRFPVLVTVPKELYDKTVGENEDMLTYNQRVENREKSNTDVCFVSMALERIPIHEIPLFNKQEFKRQHLIEESENFYIFGIEACINVDDVVRINVDQDREEKSYIFNGCCPNVSLTSTEFLANTRYEKEAKIVCDLEGNFLCCCFDEHFSNECYF